MRFACCIGGRRGMCWSMITLRRSMDGSRGRESRAIALCLRARGTGSRRESTREARVTGHR